MALADASQDGGQVLLVGLPDARAEPLAGEFRARGYDPVRLDSVEGCRERLESDGVVGVVAGEDVEGGSGAELLAAVRQGHPNVPVVLDAPEAEDHVVGEAIAEGVSLFAGRAASPATLLDRFQRVVDDEGGGVTGESERRYSSLLATSPAPINIFDRDGRTVWGNDAVLGLLGLSSREDLVGRSIFEFIHEDYHEIARRELADVVEEGTAPGPTYMQLVRADGGVRDVWVSTAPGTLDGRRIGQAVVVDITPVQEARRSLRDERGFVDDALDALADVFYVLDEDGAIERWNDAAVEVTGYSPAELADVDVEALFAPTDREAVLASVGRVLETGADTVEADILTADGRTIPYQFRGRRLTGPDGELRGIVGIGRDVSERVERVRHLRVLERFLRHNIRTDMNVVLGNAEALRGDGDVDPAAALDRVEAHCRHLLEMAETEHEIVQLLSDPPEPKPRDIGPIVRDAANALGDRYPAADVEAHAVRASASAIADLQRAIEELVENAIEHNDGDAPRVWLEVDPDDDWVTVRVRDDGPGIPEVERQVLSYDHEIDPLNHGSGLGLWYVYWVVHLSGGTIDFEPGGNEGASVVLRLPRASADAD